SAGLPDLRGLGGQCRSGGHRRRYRLGRGTARPDHGLPGPRHPPGGGTHRDLFRRGHRGSVAFPDPTTIQHHRQEPRPPPPPDGRRGRRGRPVLRLCRSSHTSRDDRLAHLLHRPRCGLLEDATTDRGGRKPCRTRFAPIGVTTRHAPEAPRRGRTGHRRARAEQGLTSAGDQEQWSTEEHEAVAELSSMAMLGRSRADERILTKAQHLEGLPQLLTAQRFDEATALLRGVDLVDGPKGRPYAVAAAMMLPEPRVPDLARQILAELVASWPGTVVIGDNEALAVIPMGDTGTDARAEVEKIRADLVHRAQVLEGGLLDHRLAIGLSSAAPAVAELRGAMVEARHARRLAELREGRSRVIAGSEIDSHELLLASVPEEVQSSYRDRLLGPLLAYDREHRSELVSTLEQFLAHSGSWQRCAAAMHVHVNTLRYRIGRVEELSGRDLSSLEHRVDLFLALKLRA